MVVMVKSVCTLNTGTINYVDYDQLANKCHSKHDRNVTILNCYI